MERYNHRTAVAAWIFLLAFSAASATEPQSTAKGDLIAQVKILQAERIKVLTDLVAFLTQQYAAGTVDAGQVLTAENELCNAQLDATDAIETRVALLTKRRDKANDFVKLVQARVDAGIASPADVFRSRSQYLGIEIRLLRERDRNTPQHSLKAPPTTK
jgi:hypothetical protein